MSQTFGFIFKISWYESKRHTKSHTDMYYLHEEDTYWAFEDNSELLKVELIRVNECSNEWQSACENSKLLHANES